MKRYFTLFLLGYFASANAQDYTIRFKSGSYQPNEGVSQHHQKAFSNETGKVCMVIQLKSLPSAAQISLLKSNGILLHKYFSNNAYMATADKSPERLNLKELGIRSIFDLKFLQKIDSRLLNKSGLPTWAKEGDAVKLQVHFYPGLNSEAVRSMLGKIGKIKNMAYGYGSAEMLVKANQISAIGSLPFVHWVEPVHPPLAVNNEPGKSLHRSAYLGSATGRNLDGAGVKIGDWDGGYVGNHEDYNSRTTIVDNNFESDHATHVAGTILGNGTLDPYATGMAPAATLYSYDYFDDVYPDMDSAYIKYGISITSNSWGYDPDFDSCPMGMYDAFSTEMDALVYNHTDLVHVFAAGNSQQYACVGGGYYTISSGANVCKNVITVAAVDYTGAMSGFSSWGPARDGRLKPEISGVGVDVYSTQPNNNYAGGWDGTSMATPGVSGTIAQMEQRYKQLNAVNPDAALIRAVVCNTADDAGNAHADYKYGFGLLNGLRAVEALEDSSFMGNTVSQGGMNSYTFTIGSVLHEMRSTLAWTDKPGDPSMSRALVNDLDMYLITPANDTIRPWILDPANPANPATRGIDTLNNIEQITVDAPATGTYTLVVNGSAIPFGPQEYFVTWLQQAPQLKMIFPNGGETFSPGENRSIRWFSEGINQLHILEYSSDGGANWTLIDSTTASDRYYDWTVPATATSQALIRVISGSDTDMCDNMFNIMHQVQNLQAKACNGAVWLNWDSAANAAYYKVYKLNGSTWNFLDSVTTNSYLETGLINGVKQFYTVRAFDISGMMGERAIASNATPAVAADGVIDMNKNLALHCGDSIQLSAIGGIAWAWSSGAVTPFISVNTVGSYKLTTTYTTGCSIASSPLKVIDALSTVALPDTNCQGSIIELIAYSEQTNTLRFTEVTQNKAGAGATVSLPAWISGSHANGDYVEVTNLGTGTMNISGYRFEQWADDTVWQDFTWPANEILAPGEISVLHLGNSGTDSAAFHFYNTGAPDDLSASGNPRGYVIRNMDGKVVDAMTMNGYSIPVQSGVVATDWAGEGEFSGGHAGSILTVADANLGKYWIASTAGTPQTLGTSNPGVASTQSAIITWTSTNGMNEVANETSDSFTQATTYTATLNAGACTKSVSYTVNFTSVGMVSISDTDICMGDSVMLVRNGGVGVQEWQMFDNMISAWTNLGISTDSFWITPAMTVMFRNYNYSAFCADSSNEVTVTVNPYAVAGTVTASDDTVCQGTQISLMLAGSTGDIAWQWFDGSTWQNGGQNNDTISFNANTTAMYRAISQTICNNEISDTVSLVVNPTPVGGTLSPTSTVICVGSDAVIHLNGSTNGTIDWETFDGNNWVSLAVSTDSLVQQPTVTTIYRAATMLAFCGAYSDTATITIHQMPTAGVTSTSDDSICKSSSTMLMLAGHANGAIDWEVLDNGNWVSTGMTTDTITVSPTADNLYRVHLDGGACGTVISDTVSIVVMPLPVGGNVSASATSVCSGTNVTLKIANHANGTLDWEMYDATNIIWVSQNASVDSLGVTITADSWYRAAVWTANCGTAYSDTATVTVTPTPVGGTISPASATVCLGSSVDLDVSNYTGSIDWEYYDSTTSEWTSLTTSTGNITLTPSTSMYVQVKATNSCGKDSSAPVLLTIATVPSAGNISPLSSAVCVGGTVILHLGNNSNGTIDWQYFDATNSTWTGIQTGVDSLIATPSETSMYRVALSDACFTSISDTATVTVNQLPTKGTVTSSADTVCIGGGVMLIASGYSNGTFQWQEFDTVTMLWNNTGVTSDTFNLNPTANVWYRAVVTSTTGCGTAISDTTAIVVVALPTVGNVTSSADTICSGLNVKFVVAPYSGNLSWEMYDSTATTWVDLNQHSDTLNAMIAKSGYYRVSVDNGYCSVVSGSKLVFANPSPSKGSAAASTDSMCVGDTAYLVQFNHTGNVDWYADFGQGKVSLGSGTPLTYVPTVTGVYWSTVTLNTCGPDSTNATTIVLKALPVAGTIAAMSGSICLGSSDSITSTSHIGTVLWEQYDSSLSAWTYISIGQSGISVSPTVSTWYRSTVTNNNCGSEVSNTIIVDVNPVPVAASIKASADSLCSGSTYMLYASGQTGTVIWEKYDSAISAYISIQSGVDSISVSPTENTMYRTSVMLGSCGPVYSAVHTIHTKPTPEAGTLVANPGSVCIGSQVQLSLTGNGSGTIAWQEFDAVGNAWNNISTGASPKNVFPYDTTVYRVRLRALGCDGYSNEVTVTTKASPNANITASSATTFCEGESVTFNTPAGTGYTFQWQRDSVNINGANARSYDATLTGNYRVMVTGGNGCSVTTNGMVVTVNVAPATPVIVRSGYVLSTAVTGVTYQWYVGGIPIAGATAQTHTAVQNGSYTVKVTNTNGCSKLSAPLAFIGLPGETTITDIQVYPNPSIGVFNLEISLSKAEAVNMKVYDMAGKLVHTEKLPLGQSYSGQIDLGNLAKGVYMLHLGTVQSNSVIRLVLQ